jgi:uncharacterized membrane protein HdeD (DUF308 family)
MKKLGLIAFVIGIVMLIDGIAIISYSIIPFPIDWLVGVFSIFFGVILIAAAVAPRKLGKCLFRRSKR